MNRTTIDYYCAPQSPWSYLGHPHFAEPEVFWGQDRLDFVERRLKQLQLQRER